MSVPVLPDVVTIALLGVFFALKKAAELVEGRTERVAPDPSLERQVAAALGPLPPGLWLSVSKRRGPGGRCARIAIGGVCPLLGVADGAQPGIELGDAALDRVFTFRGPRPLVSALMDGETRAWLLALARRTDVRPGSVGAVGGTLTVDAWWPPYRASKRGVLAAATKALALAGRLQTPQDVPARLARNALQDALRGVRLANLRALVREHACEPVTRDTLQAAAAHSDPELRLAAAQALGDEGRPLLGALARDTKLDDETSAAAIEALKILPLADLGPVLAASLGPPGGRTAPRPFTARACADTLATCGDAGVSLLADVVRSRHQAVALAGVRALRRIGTVEAVLPLKDAAEAGEETVREAARRALDDIQAGLRGTPGAVSLTGGDAGALSLSDDPSGRVSLPASTAREP